MSTQDMLSQRYGAPSAGARRLLVIATAVVTVVFLGWLGWTVYEHTTPQVTSELETFSIDDDHHVTAVLVVSLDDADVKASCTLRAYAEDHSTVGELTFTPDPAQGRRQVETIRTERRATSVEKVGCTAPGQDRPR
ncbi:DUF4307 domain-containing protein [Nocardioides halotolerans]|uniref:DUF4307 domain-containing protein n=1 Tax=Nocardioides halotolerans TaxID=433660 RepID=UPI00041530B8|nr:DUF4307 domain-containing protein [Nocardioides halotolerans]